MPSRELVKVKEMKFSRGHEQVGLTERENPEKSEAGDTAQQLRHKLLLQTDWSHSQHPHWTVYSRL